MSRLIKSIAVVDTETLKLDPTRPHGVLLDSIGVIRIDMDLPDLYNDWREFLPTILSVLRSNAFQEAIRNRSMVNVGDLKGVWYSEYDTGKVYSLSCNLPADTMTEDCAALVAALWEDESPKGVKSTWENQKTLAKTLGKGFVITYGEVHVSSMRQFAGGRTIDQKTLDFHAKNGYDPESITNRVPFKTALEQYAKWTEGCDVIFFRGTDFDVPLLNSCLIDNDVKVKYKHNRVRDIRTGLDELSDTGEYEGYIDTERDWKLENHDGTPSDSKRVGTLQDMLQVQRAFKNLRHSALVDAYTDALAYFTMKFLSYCGVSLR
jgi:hypothetical protein